MIRTGLDSVNGDTRKLSLRHFQFGKFPTLSGEKWPFGFGLLQHLPANHKKAPKVETLPCSTCDSTKCALAKAQFVEFVEFVDPRMEHVLDGKMFWKGWRTLVRLVMFWRRSLFSRKWRPFAQVLKLEVLGRFSPTLGHWRRQCRRSHWWIDAHYGTPTTFPRDHETKAPSGGIGAGFAWKSYKAR